VVPTPVASMASMGQALAMTDLDFTGRTAVVVGGGGGGIGTAMVEALARRGADIGAVTIDADHAADTTQRIESLGRRVDVRVADVTEPGALAAALADISDTLGTVDHLVNVVGGAGVDDWWRARDIPLDAFDRIIDRNVRYAMISSQWFANQLIEAAGEGTIVNISSVATRAVPLLAPYGAAKAALEAMGRTMAAEWGPLGIRVNAVAAGTVKTPRAGTEDLDEAARSIPTQRRGTPDDIANAALFLLSDMAANITGQTLTVDGGGLLGAVGETLPVFVTNPKIRDRFAD
jgi:3-oxoacyl-[acyl-carrier protein] reductase